MSQKDDSESDIWEYKPLGKKKKKQESASASGTVAKKRCTSRKTSKKDTSSTVKSPLDKRSLTVNATGNEDVKPSVIKDKQSCLEALNTPWKTSIHDPFQTDHNGEGPSSGDFCPVCQMPFSILVVQSQRWHVVECLDFPRDTCKECPDGLLCSSTIPNHYKKYNHTFLAHSRATGDTELLSLSQQATTSGESDLGCLQGFRKADGDDSTLETSQDSALSVSVPSNNSTSSLNNHNGTPPTKIINGLLLLRSPGPEDFKKKKGWSSSKGQKSISSSQESKSDLSSTPAKTENGGQPGDSLLKSELSPYNDETISYSPLSEFPVETEVSKGEPRKALFNGDTKSEDDDSLMLYSDNFSSEDELFAEFLDNFETSDAPMKEPVLSNPQLNPFASSTQSNQQATSAAAANTSAPTREKEELENSTSVGSACTNSIQSPQSIVLERLRETILNSNNLPFKNLDDSSIQSEKFQTMTPRKIQSKAGQASGLKQTDIGVFFGLKPLKEKEQQAKSGPHEPSSASGETTGERRQRRERRGRSKATTGTSQDTVTGGNNEGDVQEESGRGGTRGWRRRRWNRGGADGEVEQLPRCPFYKKIPGTKFTVDAFRYGEIDGITAYFLTHFHSDHYGGLRKNSTFPIYCNRITGNLVKSKLKVAEQYVHILPMNTQVTVEGVKVILLDANHCPGAAMLLFFLRDGQTVLHTGDFRADPSMETYPELLSCRVQTLYLDTTYCSPEYTFPKQQEVINYAANTAFELVTLNPRTLVVCGSYSVGKEKVFMALAEVLGSKVCLSRDKYNTMCCLESEQVRQRITTDWKAAQVHVLPMMQLSFKKLQDHLARFSRQYDKLVAFKPTGWTFSQQVDSVEDILPQTSGNVSIYGIPYSEHSSFLELKRFVQWLQPLKIIPTVNNGSWENRKAMERCFSEWIMEIKAKL